MSTEYTDDIDLLPISLSSMREGGKEGKSEKRREKELFPLEHRWTKKDKSAFAYENFLEPCTEVHHVAPQMGVKP